MKSGSPLAAAALLLLLVSGLTVFYTRDNGFPYYYHNDEPSKVAQLITEHRNFYHPQLLLAVTDALLLGKPGPLKPQEAVIAGRTASAGFAAGAVGLLAWLAYRLRGLAAAGSTALLAGTHPLLFELAHYMKEDCAWLFGLAAFFCAAWELEARPNGRGAFLLGAAAGLATSGKYIGIVTLPAGALFILWLRRDHGRWIGWLAWGFLAAFCLINWQALAHPVEAYTGLRMELVKIQSLTEEEGGWVRWKAVGKYLKHAWPAEAPLAGGYIAWFLAAPASWRARSRTGVEWLLILVPGVLMAMLFVAPRVYDRYVLPIVAAHALLAALGAWELGALLARWTRRDHATWIAAAALSVMASGAQWPGLLDCRREFRTDSRAELCAWLSANVPADALIAHDGRALLTRGRQESALAFPQPTIQAAGALSSLGSLDAFRGWGTHWFVVAEEDYDTLLHPPSLRVNAPQLRAEYEAFYTPLFANGERMWERPRGRLTYLHPKLQVYHLDAGR